MAEYTQKKISKLEASLAGKKIEVVGVPSITDYSRDDSNPKNVVFEAMLYDQNNLYLRIRGPCGYWLPNQPEQTLNKARYNYLPLIVSGTYYFDGWSHLAYKSTHLLVVEKMVFFKTTGALSLVDEEGNISLTDEGNLSFIKRWFQR